MSNKKTLKEVFEFFPDAQWITEQENYYKIKLFNSKEKPMYVSHMWMDHNTMA
jgi:hypothetical protein